MKHRRFFVTIEWNYCKFPEECREECTIQPCIPELEMYDGYNVAGSAGRDGIQCNIYNSLEEAILNSGFRIQYIKFCGLTDSEKLLKARIRKKILNKVFQLKKI